MEINGNKRKKAGVAILVSEKTDFKTKTVTREKEGHNDQGTNPRKGYNTCKYVCIYQEST